MKQTYSYVVSWLTSDRYGVFRLNTNRPVSDEMVLRMQCDIKTMFDTTEMPKLTIDSLDGSEPHYFATNEV